MHCTGCWVWYPPESLWIVRARQKYVEPSGKRDNWIRIIPGVMNAAKTFQRGHAPENRAKWMPLALNRFEMFPATSIRIMWKGTPFEARPPERGEAMAHLFEADAEPSPHDVDVVALLPARLEKRSVREDDGAREVVGERYPRERSRLVRREMAVGHDAVDLRPLRQERDLVSELERARAGGQELAQREDLLLHVESPQNTALGSPRAMRTCTP